MKATEMIFFLIKKPIVVCILTPKMKNERGKAEAVNRPKYIFTKTSILKKRLDIFGINFYKSF